MAILDDVLKSGSVPLVGLGISCAGRAVLHSGAAAAIRGRSEIRREAFPGGRAGRRRRDRRSIRWCCDRRPLSGNRARYGRGAQGKGRKPGEPVCLQGPGWGAPAWLGRAGRGAAISSSARKARPRARTRAPSCQTGTARRSGSRVRHARATSFQSETIGYAASRRAAAGACAARSEVK
jgi:hypothetical protein